MTRSAPLALAGLLLAGLACGSNDEPWAHEADNWNRAFIELPNEVGGIAFDRLWAPGVVLDSRSIAEGSPLVDRKIGLEVAELTMPPDTPNYVQETEPLISTTAALTFVHVDWSMSGLADTPDTALPAHLVTVTSEFEQTGAGSMVSAMSTSSWRERRADHGHADAADEIARQWIQTWSSSDTGDVADLYTGAAVVTDSIGGNDASGLDGIAAMRNSRTGVEDWRIASWPDGSDAVYAIAYEPEGLVAVVVVVDGSDEAGCPRRMGLLLRPADQRVNSEERFWTTDQSRDCLDASALPQGWWTDWTVDPELGPVPFEDLELVTGTVSFQDQAIEVRNSNEQLDRLLEWGLRRFDDAGLQPPSVDSVVFSTYSAACDETEGRTTAGGDGWEILICKSAEQACQDDLCTEFTLAARHVIIHELAHVWLEDFLSQDQKQDFTDSIGLDDWYGEDRSWAERGAEHAAEYLSWGLLDSPIYMARIDGPSARSLGSGFARLTGAEPIQPYVG